MSYQPTGKPPGRPRKDAETKPEVKPAQTFFPHAPRNFPHSTIDMSKNGVLCEICYPEGLPQWRSIGCPHGVWFNR